MKKPSSPFVFTPTESSTVTQYYLTRRIEAIRSGDLSAGVSLYIPGMDIEIDVDIEKERFLPLVGGEIMTLVARPGHGKTSFMMRWARRRAREIAQKAATGNTDAARRVVVYCTLEQTVEELSTFHVAAESKISITRMATGRVSDEQWNDITGVLAHRMTSPLWFVGYGGERRTKQRLDMAAIENGLDEIAEWDGDGGFVLDCVFLDYLQRIPYEGESKVIGISNNLDEIARYAKSRGVPFVCGVQAVRDVDKRDDPTPLLDDGQWTSNIEQASDKCASLVRPCQYKGQGEAFGGVAVEGYSQMVISFLKQKLGRANWRKWLNLDPRYNDLAAAELKNALPDDHKDY